ncbi:protein bark beetle isoform X2 [Pectinophora gossypiella]|uniref:protein bark beetle isoform X2 n=1 Tax=Pectinophora gossypiella TaxID=13191 RepID=UPI00214F0727|nr:protein bark beetle isoform X2 [Pectinophora gossypiella]
MECSKDMGVQKRHSQFSDTKYKWRTVLVLCWCMSVCCGQELRDTDPWLLNRSAGLTELEGGVVAGRVVWKAEGSPYLLRDDLLVESAAELVVEPGVEVRFAPMIGVTVRGKLIAVGHHEKSITFTSTEEPVRPVKPVPDIRLVDGPTILAGRVQLLHRGQWRSVCTNSRNWTINDMETACRQLGFMGGSFYNWMDRQPGRKARLLFEEPRCRGTEDDLFQCDWNSRQLGSGVCDYHPDLAIQCSPHHDGRSTERHWRGIRFENAVYERILTAVNTLYVPTSMSRLEHVVIKNAGLGRDNNATSAVDVIGVPPVMEDIEIANSAFNAINVTSPNAPIVINNCTIQNNRGYGVYVNSTYGMTKIENCLIHDNGGDGVKYVVHEMSVDEKFDRSEVFDLCTLASTPSQTFPIQMSIEQSRYSNMERDCSQKFYTRSDHVLTLSFLKLLTNHNDTGEIFVYDGLTVADKLLMSFSIRNLTRPQSVTSTRSRMYVRFRANTRTDITGFLRLTSGVSKTYDLNVTDSIISDNNGRGVVIENLRSQVHIHRSSISNNNHVAGLQVVNGAGDVNVTESRISFNQGDGINITVTGGNRNISRSILSSNQGYGIAVWINNTQETEYIPLNQTTVVEYSEIFKNLEIGILHGNYCGDSWVNITGNWFNTSMESTIDISTCWRYNSPVKLLNLQIGHNRFYQNRKVPLKIQPALNVVGRIEYNYFEHGDYGAIVIMNRIEGKYIEEFEILPARFHIQHNYFYSNKGPFVVNLGLSPYSDLQYILFSRNYLRDNKIREPYEPIEGVSSRLAPRSRVAATIVLASSNIDVFRNIINNPEAQYEIGSHVEDQSKILNCTYNWLGFGEEEKIYNRLFHRKDRYNLAKIIYMPYLLHSSNPGATQINYNSLYVPQFNVPGTFIVGGEVEGIEILRQGEYDVDKDINIRPGGKLVLQPGVTLRFPPSIGMMIAGKLDARGKRPNDITFTLKEELVMTNDSFYETDADVDPTTPGYVEPIVPIRLLGGRTQQEGRLQVRVDGRWGTVCNYRWNIINAALVCHQLGLALNPDDWFLEPSEIPTAGMTEDIILSNVECTEFDNDITKCKAETIENFEKSCTHENDVGIRCYETSWAGMRFSVIAERTDLQYVTVEKAGLLDYSSNVFKPALQIDFARHSLESVKISNNYHDGLGILYSDLYGADAVNTVRNSEFSNNKGSGISFKQLGLKVYGSVIENNEIAGISHNPHLTGQQQREIAGWFNLDPGFNMDESNYHPIMIPEYETDISLVNGETRHLVFTKHYGENIAKSYNIKCNPGYVLGLQLLNPIHNFSTESICIYDSQNINEGSTKWCLDRDLATFPTTSNSFGVVLTYESGNVALGGVVLVVSSILAPVQNLRNRIVKGPVPTLQVANSKIKGNTKGVKALYYNRYLNELGDHFLRKANESIKIFNCEIAHNKEEAIYVNTPFWDIHESNITEITIMVNSSLITDNGRGIYHFARDLRSSNNLYHYILQDNTVERNKNGGFDVSLPYVWQYNENFTHSVFMYNNTWRSNQNFGLVIDGHFAEVNITKNIFTDNNCKTGLVSIRGMEKKMKVDGNFIERNNGQYMVEFYMDSQSEIMGLIYAVFVYNQVKNNRYTAQMNRGALFRNVDPTYVIGFKGIQKVKVSRNIFGLNGLQYTLLAGIKTAKIENLLDVTENWWGSADEKEIKRQIFDFDDWNNHAIASYLPYLVAESFDASVSVSFSTDIAMDVNELGGRLKHDLVIEARIAPYIVKSDITVMPNVTLTINPGVILEFAPNVGILVMGTLHAIGHSQLPIFMKPIASAANIETNRISKRDVGQYSGSHHKYRRQLENLIVQESIRLCSGRNCSINDNMAEKTNEGFLEYYNRTTLQWVPMCDNRFTERNAQVVCRELGFDPINVFFAHDRRVEYHSNSLSRIWSWPEPLQCVGTEDRYEDCPIRLNGQLYGHRHECKWDSEFVFIHCGMRNLEENLDYWGGIRFANPEFEYSLYEHRIHDHHTHDTMKKVESIIEHVQIVGAGLLHNEKSPAIQSIVKNPRIQNVNISKCAHHGINLISPTDTISMMFNSVNDILGEGVSAISLTGEGRESEESSFTPLKDLNLPYHLFSLIDICDSSKVVVVEERVLLYYKYDNNPVNCVKIFKSMYRVKPFGFRLLQYNLFNHTQNYGKRDSLSLYDGDIYNITAPMIGYLENGSPDEKKLFRTQGASLSVKLFANGASAVHGFIAEIVTLPISAIGFNRDVQHNISNSEFHNNRDGAISYQSVGEVNPLVAIIRNEIDGNCLKLYGNFTSCQSAVRIDVQNTQTLVFRNNLVRNNVGGLSVRADSRGSATSLRGWIHNNLFYGNHDLPCLMVEGRQSSPYQEVTIYRNYFTRHRAQYKDVIVLNQVVSNFTYNYVHDNTGMRILEVSGFDKVRLPIYQTTSHNGFYKNYALDREGRATVVAGTAGQHYVDNIFFNPDNDYEMITVNRSISLELWRTKIDAKHNYWSYNESLAVAGRIRDQSDNPLLLEVDYRPYYMNNLTVLGGGKCPPGWDHVAGTCYMYVGAPMTYEEARTFCLSDNASMPYVSGNYAALYQFIQRQNEWFQYGDRVWVNHIDYVTQCTSFAFSTVEITDCNQKNPFICEIDPKITIDPLSWRGDILAVAFIGILAAAVLLVGAALICWYSKSKHRHLQRLERRNSIRQSLHSVRSIGSINGGFPDTAYRRKLAQMSTRSTETLTKGSDYKKMLASTTSMESMEKSQFNSSMEDNQSFDIYEAHNPNANVMPLKHSTFMKKPVTPEYSVPQNNNKPFSLAYRNEGYRDNSGPASGAPSMNTVTTEELPIIHHPGGLQSPQDDDTLSPTSDQYYNSDTLPLRGLDKDDTTALKRELEREGKIYGYGEPSFGGQPKLSFLMELRSKMPEQPQPGAVPTTTFGQRRNIADQQQYYEDNLPSPPHPPIYSNYDSPSEHIPSYDSSPQDLSRSFDDSPTPEFHGRSKSEALLETNFDFEDSESSPIPPLSEANRSHSQPLETAM